MTVSLQQRSPHSFLSKYGSGATDKTPLARFSDTPRILDSKKDFERWAKHSLRKMRSTARLLLGATTGEAEEHGCETIGRDTAGELEPDAGDHVASAGGGAACCVLRPGLWRYSCERWVRPDTFDHPGWVCGRPHLAERAAMPMSLKRLGTWRWQTCARMRFGFNAMGNRVRPRPDATGTE